MKKSAANSNTIKAFQKFQINSESQVHIKGGNGDETTGLIGAEDVLDL